MAHAMPSMTIGGQLAPTAANAASRLSCIGSWRSSAVSSKARRCGPLGQAIASSRPAWLRLREALISSAIPEESTKPESTERLGW